MISLKFCRVSIGFTLLLLFASGCSPVPIAIPQTATLAAAPEDNPTAGAIVRSTRQARATVTGQAELVARSHASRY